MKRANVAVGLGLGAVLVTAACVGDAQADGPPPAGEPWRVIEQETELGQIRFERDYAVARERAKAEGKPLFVLFQEVPGCSTCTGYGGGVLSDPILVESVETLCVPVVVRNNVGGAEREVLERFGEPTWANPSARVVDPQDERSFSRVHGDYTLPGTLNMLVRGLKQAGHTPPAWLALHAGGPRRARAVYAMACFWSGEARLGALDGVTKTRTGWLGGSEVVEVEYDPARLDRATLDAHAERSHCQVSARDGEVRATPGDDKYQIRETRWAHVPLTETQATRINALLGDDARATPLLTPRQRELLALVRAHPDADWPHLIGLPYPAALARAEAVAARLETPPAR